MKKKLKIDFADFSEGFEKESNYFFALLSSQYDVEITDSPDFLIYSVFGLDYLNYDCIRILYTGENRRPNFDECDYAFSFDFSDDKRNFRLPFYSYFCDTSVLTRPKPDPDTILKGKTGFCNMVTSNPMGKDRATFFHKLSDYKRVDSGGKYLNNVGGPVADKMAFIKNYKFSIAFENSCYPGYTTEKIVEAMTAHTIPIYWGNPLVQRDFNTKSFVNCHDYANFDEVVRRIKEIDNDDGLYRSYMEEPYFVDNIPNEFTDTVRVLKQFEFIFENKGNIIPVAQQDRRHSEALVATINELTNEIERLEHERRESAGPGFSELDKAIGKAKSELIHSMNKLEELMRRMERKRLSSGL